MKLALVILSMLGLSLSAVAKNHDGCYPVQAEACNYGEVQTTCRTYTKWVCPSNGGHVIAPNPNNGDGYAGGPN